MGLCTAPIFSYFYKPPRLFGWTTKGLDKSSFFDIVRGNNAMFAKGASNETDRCPARRIFAIQRWQTDTKGAKRIPETILKDNYSAQNGLR